MWLSLKMRLPFLNLIYVHAQVCDIVCICENKYITNKITACEQHTLTFYSRLGIDSMMYDC